MRLEQDEGRVRLSIADTGAGISPEVLPHLFERFVQADSSVTRTQGGLGLGLAIVRYLVEAHGGEVHAESPGAGKGATFHVTLPTGATDSAQPPMPDDQAVRRTINDVRVLLIEDDEGTRQAYEQMLIALGAEVRAEASAAEGLAALEEFRPQVILCDIAMPGEDGFSFLRRLRRLPPQQGGGVPAAALTALASEEDRKKAIESGFQVHVAKPIDAAKLAAVVATLADRGSIDDAGTKHMAESH